MRKFKGIIFMLVFSIVFSYLAPIVKAVENYSNTTEKTPKTQQTQQVQKETEKKEEIAKQQIQDNEENENVIKQQSESTEEENKGVSQQGEDVEEEEIQFASEELKARLVNEYDTNGDGKLVPSEVKDVTKLGIYWSNNEPTDISGIENFVSLEEIYLTNCKNFQILTQLPKLKTVRISERIDAEELKQLENIKLLNALGFDEIGFNELDISNLADRLEKLSISSINDINLKRLQNFSKLTELNISYIWNGITGLDMINNFTSLKKLQISDCSIVKDIEFLRNNSTIEELDIHGNSVEDLSPIETMSNLKSLSCYSNNIKDISILENSNLINSSRNMQQSLVINNVLVEKGKKTEIELPQTIRKAFDETSRFYMEDAELVINNENSVLSVNSDKTKVIIDATQMDIGTSSETLYLNGNGALSNTSLTINFYVVIDGDKNQEIQFKSDKLKQYLLEHDIDIDGDNKITAFDMAQIKTLDLSTIDEEKMDLQGLEYATLLENLHVEKAINYDVLTGLQNLKSLYVREIYYQDDYNSICNLQNLQELTLSNVDFVDKYDFNQLPKTLDTLQIQYSKLDNIERINEFTNLNELRISGLYYEIKTINGLEKINELKNLKKLGLSLGEGKIENVDFLKDNDSIEELDISNNYLTNIDVLETMKNLKGINISYNNIQDLTVVKRLNLQTDKYYSELRQSIKLKAEVEQGESIEIDLPQLIKDMMNPNDEFYLNNLQISQYSIFGYDSIEPISKINDEKTKIILRPTINEIGEGREEFTFYGDGKLSSTTIDINYTILGKGDKNKEVQFEDEVLKQQIEDYDNDGKITEFDMAQIKTLNLQNGNGVENLKGLEYAKNLKELRINISNKYINGHAIPVDVSVLGGLTDLKLLDISGTIADLQFIENLANLTDLDIYLNSDINNIETIKSLENLKRLEVYLGNGEQINIIKDMTNLESLCVYGQVTTIEPLINISNLKRLEISRTSYEIKSINGLERINELQNLKSLRLSLGQCKIENVDFLKDNNSIENLDVSDNYITNIDVLKTMKNLKSINISYNNIQDLAVIKNLKIENFDSYSLNQRLQYNVEIEQGGKIEIELPQVIKDIMNPNDEEFYLKNLRLEHSAEFEHNDIEPVAKINDEKTKIIFEPIVSEMGTGEEFFNFYGDGILNGTSIYISYTIIGNGDKNKEVQFEDEYLKQQLQACDYDNDGKITEYDMAQIRKLNLQNGSGVENLKGLEYAKNLKELRIYIKGTYINGQAQPVDLSVLGTLTTLNLLDISGTVLDIKFLENLTNLTDLDIYLNSDVKNAESITKLENLKSLSVSLGKSEQIELIKGMTTLENLNISGQVETLEPLINLTKLRALDISGDFQQLKDLFPIAKMNNLGNLWIRRYTVYNGEAKKFDYSFLKNLSSLYSLTIEDKYLNLDCANLPNSINYLYLTCNELCNTDKMEQISKLSGLSIGKNKIKDIEFVKNLKLNWLNAEDNLIIDISPLEYCTATYVNLVNNPIDIKEEKNAKIIELYKKNNKTLNITDSEKTKNIDFENEEFKQKLVKEYDLNRDGEISIYEIEKIEYLYLESYIEKVEYLTNLKRLSFSNINLSKDEQEKLIKELDKLNSNVEVGISLVSIDLGKIKQNTTKKIDLNESVPLLAEMQKEGSRLYQGKLIFKDGYYNEENTAEYKNDKLILNTSIIGQRNYTVYYEIEGKQYSLFKIEVKWSNITDGDKSKEINIKDANFKKALLENYDIDGDKKFTENDAVNIGTLEISGYQIESLSGIENFKNLYSINAYNNYIADITPVMGLKKLEYANFYSNNITDITCLKNRKFKLVTALGIDGNYIDLSNNSVQVKTYLDEMQKDIGKYGEDEYYKEGKALLASFATSQKIGKPTTQNNEVKMDSKIKAKLISLGADLNKDGKLTPKELRDATQGRYENGEYIEAIIESVDLSNLGLTSVEGIQYLSGLKEINLSHNKISDLTPLSYMMNLKKIDLSYNNITDISKLPNYAVNSVAAKTVNLSHNQIKDISCVKNWVITNTTTYCGWQSGGDPNFRVLDLDFSYNKIEDISAVKNYKTLAKLNLSHNNITDISSLKDYNFLLNEEIEEDNEWSEIREDLSNFKGIDLSSNYIDLTQAGNKKAIQAFKNKKVEINAQNQGTKLSFKDVPENEWYYEAVKYVYEKKIILGYNTTTFAPDDKITRGMLVTILYRMEGSPKVTAVSKFSDVQNTKEYYYNAVNWAVANNIVSGYSDPKSKGKFGPDDNITREQLAVILWKYSKYKGKFRVVKTDFSKFTDSAKISEYAKNGMNWALGVEVMHGSGGKLNPQGTATRAEAAAMLSNYCKKY